MRVLVTGGAGFIGSHIIEHLQGKADIRVLDNLRSGFRRNLDGLACEFILMLWNGNSSLKARGRPTR